MDLSKLSDTDLDAVLAGDMAKVSDAGLSIITGEPPKAGLLKTVGTGLLGGAAGVVAKAGAAYADKAGADELAHNLRASEEYWKQQQAAAGGDTFAGKTADVVGSMVPGFLAGAVGAPTALSAAALYAAPAALDTYTERKKEGDSTALALAQAGGAGAINQYLGSIAGGGTKALSKALGVGEGVLPQLGMGAAEMAGFTAGATAIPKAIDTAAGKDTNAPWVPNLSDLGPSAVAGALMRGAHMAVNAPAQHAAQAEKDAQDAAAAKAAQDAQAAQAASPSPPAEVPISRGMAGPGRPTNLMPQPDLFGAPEIPNGPAAPEAVPPQQRKDELAQQIRTLSDTLEDQRAKVANAATPEESLVQAQQFNQLQTARNAAQQEHDGITVEASVDEKLARVYKQWGSAQEQGDVDATAKFAQRIVELKAAGATPPPAEGMTQANIPLKSFTGTTEGTDAFNQRVVGPEMAAGREAAAAARQKVVAESAGLQRIAQNPLPDSQLPAARQAKQTAAEIAQMEAARINPLVTEQMTIPGTAPELASKVVRGVGTASRPLADIQASFEAAKATRDRPATLAAIEEMRDYYARQHKPEAPTGSLTQDLATPEQRSPVAARGQALVQLLQAKPEDVEAARGRLLERLASDIESTTGKPIPQSQRYALAAEANPVLDTLMKSAKQMTDARKAQGALDAIRNRLAKHPVETTVERTFAKDTPEETPAAPVPDTKTVDMFPAEKAAAEQHVADQQKYEEVFNPPKVESQADREARDAAERITEQQTAENLGALPGVSVSHEAYRTALDRLEQAPQRIEELLNKANDETQPKSTRDKAKRQVKALNQSVILASGMLAHAGAKMAEAKAKVQARLDVVREKIDNKRAAAEETGLKKTTLDSRRRELAKLVREERTLNRLNFGLENRAKITTIKGQEERQTAAEDRAAKLFLEKHLALEQEGTTGKLPARKIGPLVKNVVQAGETRTNSPESMAGENKTGSRNPATQAGAKRGVTAKQAMRAAEPDADKLTQKAAQEELAAANKKPPPRTRAERAIEESEFADEATYDTGGYRDFNPKDSFEGEWEASAKQHADETGTLLSPETRLALHEGNTQGAVDGLIKNASTPEVARLAENLKPYLEGVKIGTDENVKHEGKSVAGIYEEGRNVVTMHPDRLTEEDTLHELTHAATATVLNTPDAKLAPYQVAAKRGLTGMWEQMKGNAAFAGEYALKSVKEFASEVYSNPNLRAKMDSMGKPTSLLQRFKTFVARMFGGGKTASEKVLGLIDKILSPAQMQARGETTAKPSPLKNSFVDRRTGLERLKDTTKGARGLGIEQAMFDKLASLNAVLRKHGDYRNSGVYALHSVFQSDHLINMVHGTMADGAYGLSKDEQGHSVLTPGHGPKYEDLAAAITKMKLGSAKNNMDGFHSLEMGLHAEQVGWDKLDLKDLAAARKEWLANMQYVDAHPDVKAAFESASKVYQKMNRAQVDLVEQTYALPADVIADMRKLTHYTPMYRINGDSLQMLGLESGPRVIGDIRKQPWLHALEGGDDKLMPLESSILRNTTLLTGMAMRNFSTTQVAYHLQDLGKAAKVMQILPGKGPDRADVVRFTQAPFKDTPGDTGDRHIIIDTKGTTAEGIPTELLVRALAGVHQINSPLLKIASYANGLLRSGVTRMPSYLLSQTGKDAMNASMMGSVKGNPVSAAYNSAMQLFKGYAGTGAEHHMMEKYGSSTSSNVISGSGDMHKILLQMAAGEGRSGWAKFKAVLDTTAMAAEGATRAQILKDIKRSGGTDIEAIYKAEQSMDFGAKGADPAVRFVGQLVPFFHASMTGLNNYIHSIKGDMPSNDLLQSKRRMTQRAIGMAGFAVAYAMMMEDDKEWKAMPLRDKLAYFHLPLGTWNGEKVKIGIPFQPGVMFYSLPLAMVENWKKDFSREDWKTVRDLFISELVPSGGEYGAQILKGTGAIAANYDPGTGRPIESPSMAKLTPEQRFGATTSEISKQFSKHLVDAGVRLSPVQLDYLANSYFGQLPLQLAKMADDMVTSQAENVQKPTKHLSEGMLGRFFQKAVGTDAVDHVYELDNRAQEVQNTLNKLKREGRGSEIKDFVQSHQLELAIAKIAPEFTAAMSKLTQQEQLIRFRAGMAPDVKQQQIDSIRAKKAAIAERFQTMQEQFKKRFSSSV